MHAKNIKHAAAPAVYKHIAEHMCNSHSPQQPGKAVCQSSWGVGVPACVPIGANDLANFSSIHTRQYDCSLANSLQMTASSNVANIRPLTAFGNRHEQHNDHDAGKKKP